MREYARFPPAFWQSKLCKDIRRAGVEGIVMAAYLKTAPLSNMLGLYSLSLPAAGHDTGLGFEGASKGLRICIEAGYCAYDEDSEFVWVFDMAREQIGAVLKVTDNQVKNVQTQYAEMEENPFLERFFDRYGVHFHLPEKRLSIPPATPPSEGASEPLRSKAQAKAQAQEQGESKGESDSNAKALLAGGGQKSVAKKPAQGDQPGTPSAQVWRAYEAAFQARYGTAPTRNAKVNGQLAQFVARVPAAEAPEVAVYFVSLDKRWYVESMHSVDCLLKDAEALHAQFRTGTKVSSAQANLADRAQASNSAFDRMIEQAKQRGSQASFSDMDDDGDVIDVEMPEVRP